MREQPRLDLFERSTGAARSVASFPLPGPGFVVTFEPIPECTQNASPFGMTDLGDGNFLVVYTLDAPFPDIERGEVGGVGLGTYGPTDPFLPLQTIIVAPISDTDFRCVIVGNGKDQPAGSPDVRMDFHCNIWTPNRGVP